MKLLLTGLGALSLAGMALWCWQADSFGWRQALGLCSWFVAAALGLRALRHAPKGRIRWDGANWYWDELSSDLPGQLQVVVDAQSLPLLRWHGLPEGGSRANGGLWLWAEQSVAPPAWIALRRAVYSRSMADQTQGATATPS